MIEKKMEELGLNYNKDIYTDVLIAGGGPAGIGAAVGAAKDNKNSLLIDKNGFLGGMATLAAVSTICGGYSTDKSQKIIGGVYQEWLDELNRLGGLKEGVDFGKHRADICDHHLLKAAGDRLLLKYEVNLFLHTSVIGVKTENNNITNVLISNKEGISRIFASQYIDATGDADIAALGGAPYTIGDENGKTQAATTVFKMGNVDIDLSESNTKESFSSIIQQSINNNKYNLHRPSGVYMTSAVGNSVICNMNWISNFSALDGKELSEAEIKGREASIEYSRFLKDKVPGFNQAYLSEIATQIGIRETRRIEGKYKLTEKEVLEGATFSDGIALGGWPVEYHDPTKNNTQKTYLDQNYQIPYSTLLPKKIDNLLVAGRSISTTHYANASTRVMATCLALGHAAGIASSHSINDKSSPKNINIYELKQKLLHQKAIL